MPIDPVPLLARAVAGDAESVAVVLADPVLAGLAEQHRVAPRLALLADDLKLELPEPSPLRQALRSSAVRHLLLDQALAALGERLAVAGVRWCPIKGADVRHRLYERPEERVVGDLDVLVAEGDLPAARAAAHAAGFGELHPPGRRYEAFLRDEGYAWQGTHASWGLLEVHYRLWGQLPAAAAAEILATARPTGEGSRYELPWESTWLVSAAHLPSIPSPRPLAAFWELALLGARLGAAELEAIGDRIESWGAEALVLPGARVAASLFGDVACRALTARFEATLRFPERRLLRVGELDPEVSLSRLVLARLLAGRPSRSGWAVFSRWLWPHPGVVERGTPQGWSWCRRRLWHVSSRIRSRSRPEHVQPTLNRDGR